MNPQSRMDAFLGNFPRSDELVHLNNAGLTPLPVCVREAVLGLMAEALPLGQHGVKRTWGSYESARTAVARFLDAKPESLAFTGGCSDALSLLAGSLEFAPGDEILSFEGEYPSNSYCWLDAAARTGARFVRVPLGEGHVFDTEALVSSVNSRTRLVSVSWVQSVTGQVLDLEPMAEACRKVGAMFVVDVIQGVGILPFSFEASGADAIAFGSHKWLCGLLGTGGLVVREEWMDRLRPRSLGAMSFGTPDDAFDVARPLRSDAKKFEPGTANIPGAVALMAAVRMLDEAGVGTLRARALELKARLVEGLLGQGLRLVGANADPGGGSPIVTFVVPRADSAGAEPDRERNRKVSASLDAGKISHIHRFDLLRLSPHAFNTPGEVDHALDSVRAALRP
jgi:cysteine desulfurase/selenocysteine lyase